MAQTKNAVGLENANRSEDFGTRDSGLGTRGFRIPQENTNFAAKQPEVVKKLLAQLAAIKSPQ